MNNENPEIQEDEPKIKVELDPHGTVQYTVPEEIYKRNHVEIDYSTFIDIDTNDYVYQLHFRLEPKDNPDGN